MDTLRCLNLWTTKKGPPLFDRVDRVRDGCEQRQMGQLKECQEQGQIACSSPENSMDSYMVQGAIQPILAC